MLTPPCTGHEFEAEEYKTTTMEIEKDLLVGVKYIPSPNISGKFKINLPDTIIIHYTAGSSASSSIKTLTTKGTQASAHIVVGRDGEITQLVPFDTIAWHAGKSEYEGRKSFNQYSIGIEIDNAGLLTKEGNTYKSWFGKEYPKEEVVEGIHRNGNKTQYWHKYTDKQIQAVKELCSTLTEHYCIKHILGHEEISVGRKIDPGPAFPLDELRSELGYKDK